MVGHSALRRNAMLDDASMFEMFRNVNDALKRGDVATRFVVL